MGKMRPDGFVCASAGPRGGVFETKTLDLINKQLYVNADRLRLTHPRDVHLRKTDLKGAVIQHKHPGDPHTTDPQLF